jgi:hypothetical protein
MTRPNFASPVIEEIFPSAVDSREGINLLYQVFWIEVAVMKCTHA